MVYNKQYNTRHSGRYNTGGQFVSAGVEKQQAPPAQQPSQPQPSYQQRPPPPAQSYQTQQPPAPAPAPAPPPPQQTFPAQPAVEEPDVQMKVEVDAEASGEEPIRPHWMKLKTPGVKKLSKKEKRRRQNQHLRRIITPKNALMVLNEMVLHEQLTNQFRVEPAEPPTQYYKSHKSSFCADLTVDGLTYKGYGENKLMARNAAAEQAIRALIIKRMNRCVAAEAPAAAGTQAAANEDNDPLPMIQLASYALHKLFSEWEYEGHKVPQLRPPTALASDGTSQAASEWGDGEEQDMQHRPPAASTSAEGEAPRLRLSIAKPPKRLPLNAAAMHPCMLLTYMRPALEYRELAVEGDRPQNMLFTMGVDVEAATYIGKASNKKEARKAAAKSACMALFGVQFDDHATATAPVVPPEA